MRVVYFSRTLVGIRQSALAIVLLFFAFTGLAHPGEAVKRISLEEALDIALKKNPRIVGQGWDVWGGKGRIHQASVLPNPELELEVENVGGDLDGFGESETTVGISQVVETAGKRGHRIRIAREELRRIGWEGLLIRREVLAETSRSFVELLGAEQRFALIRQAQEITAELYGIARERVKEGAISPIEETRARVALALADAESERTAREVRDALAALSAAMGERAPSFEGVKGELAGDASIPELSDLENRLKDHPGLRMRESEKTVREASLASTKAQAFPDATVRAGFRYFAEDSLHAFVFGASVPIPVFDANRGTIREAQAAVSKAREEERAEEARLRRELARAHSSLSGASTEARLLREGALAGAQGAYEAVREGYNLGKFRYLDLLDAGRTLVETRLRYVDSLVRLNLARVEIEFLAGGVPPGDIQQEILQQEILQQGIQGGIR